MSHLQPSACPQAEAPAETLPTDGGPTAPPPPPVRCPRSRAATAKHNKATLTDEHPPRLSPVRSHGCVLDPAAAAAAAATAAAGTDQRMLGHGRARDVHRAGVALRSS